MVGVEVRDGGALAVVIDERGSISARADVAGADPGAATISAVERVTPVGSGLASLGVAATSVDAPASVRALASLKSRYPDLFTWQAVVASGLAAALAESWIGAARGVTDVVYLATTAHVVAGVVRGGAPVTGANGRAPAIGWLALNPVEREDYRKAGCLESEVSAAGIARRLVWRLKAGDHSRVPDMVNGDLTAITVDRVIDAAREGDGVAVSVIRETAKYLGMAAANLVAIADPNMLVLGGIMASAADLFLEPVRAEISRRLAPAMTAALAVAPASLGGDAAAIGAARYASIVP